MQQLPLRQPSIVTVFKSALFSLKPYPGTGETMLKPPSELPGLLAHTVSSAALSPYSCLRQVMAPKTIADLCSGVVGLTASRRISIELVKPMASTPNFAATRTNREARCVSYLHWFIERILPIPLPVSPSEPLRQLALSEVFPRIPDES